MKELDICKTAVKWICVNPNEKYQRKECNVDLDAAVPSITGWICECGFDVLNGNEEYGNIKHICLRKGLYDFNLNDWVSIDNNQREINGY